MKRLKDWLFTTWDNKDASPFANFIGLYIIAMLLLALLS
jgi:hypothetical protein